MDIAWPDGDSVLVTRLQRSLHGEFGPALSTTLAAVD